jgi:hypothetical protein
MRPAILGPPLRTDSVPDIPDYWFFIAGIALAAAGVSAWAFSPVAFDDAFISYRYANNLVSGHGLVFNPGERVEGYTNFLWVMFSAAAIATGADPFTVTRLLGVAAYASCILMVVAAAKSMLHGQGTPRVEAVLGLVGVLVVTRSLARLAGAGLETFFVSACLLGAGMLFHFTRSRGVADAAGSMLALAAVLTRMDAVLGVLASILATMLETGVHRALWLRLARRYTLPISGLAALALWRLWYYGSFVPNSFHAKDAGGWHLQSGLAYVAGYVVNSPSVLVMAALATVGLSLTWRTRFRAWQVFLCGFLLLHTMYVVKVGGDFMYYRFMFEALPFLVSAAASGLALLRVRREWITPVIAAACVSLSMTPRYLEQVYAMQSVWEMDSYVALGREVGLRLRDTVPEDTVIATSLAGTVPYYAGLITIDQLGLNDAAVARQPVPETFGRGHVKIAPVEYLLERGVNLVISHPVVCSCDKPCAQGGSQVFIRLADDRCVRTTYLVQTRDLTRHFCNRAGADFILRNVSCGR